MSIASRLCEVRRACRRAPPTDVALPRMIVVWPVDHSNPSPSGQCWMAGSVWLPGERLWIFARDEAREN
jgi:hypothetical protein